MFVLRKYKIKISNIFIYICIYGVFTSIAIFDVFNVNDTDKRRSQAYRLSVAVYLCK